MSPTKVWRARPLTLSEPEGGLPEHGRQPVQNSVPFVWFAFILSGLGLATLMGKKFLTGKCHVTGGSLLSGFVFCLPLSSGSGSLVRPFS